MTAPDAVANLVARAICQQIIAGQAPIELARRYGITPGDLLRIVRQHTARTGSADEDGSS
jgi:hypothetical protein